MNFNRSNDTLIKLDRLSFVHYLECSTSLPIIYVPIEPKVGIILGRTFFFASRLFRGTWNSFTMFASKLYKLFVSPLLERICTERILFEHCVK